MSKPGHSPGSRFLPLLAILVLAAGVRAAVTFEHYRLPVFSALRLDENPYDEWAQETMTGHWFLDFVPNHGPGYPWTLGLLYRLFGRHLLVPRLFSAGLGVLGALVIYHAGRRLFGPGPGLVSCLLLALYWPLLVFEQRLLAASLFFFLNLAALLTGIAAAEKDRTWRWALAGAIMGAAVITWPSSLAWLVLALAWLLWRAGRSKTARTALPILALAAGASLFILPVLVKNHALSGGWLLQANTGMNLYIGNNPGSDGTPYARPGGAWDAIESMPFREAGHTGEAQQDRYYLAQVIEFATHEPGRFLALQARKLLLTLNGYEIRATLDPGFLRSLLKTLSLPLPGFGLVLALALPGLLAVKLKRRDHQWLLLYLAAYLGATAATVVSGRYRLPLAGGLILLAGPGVVRLAAVLAPMTSSVRAKTAAAWKPAVLPVGLLLSGLALSSLPLGPGYTLAEEWVWLGDAWFAQGQADRARESYRKALELEPGYALALGSQARVEHELGNREAGLRLQAQAVAADPQSASAHHDLGLLLWQAGKQQEALAELETAVTCRPQWVEGLFNLARAEVNLGLLDRARTHLAAVLALRPDHDEARFILDGITPGPAGPARPGSRAPGPDAARSKP